VEIISDNVDKLGVELPLARDYRLNPVFHAIIGLEEEELVVRTRPRRCVARRVFTS
jgi:hypothetical protein